MQSNSFKSLKFYSIQERSIDFALTSNHSVFSFYNFFLFPAYYGILFPVKDKKKFLKI